MPFGAGAVPLFQSLIGRLKTPTAAARLRTCCKFQSLIGRLKTLFVQILVVFVPDVSIPHR